MSAYMETRLTNTLVLCKIAHHTTPHHTTPHHTTLTSFLLFSGRRSLLAWFAIQCIHLIHLTNCVHIIHFTPCVYLTNYVHCTNCIHFTHCIFIHCVHSTHIIHCIHFIHTGIKNRCAGTRPLPALHDDFLCSPSALKGGDISTH